MDKFAGRYKYTLSLSQYNLIIKINEIRQQHNIPKLKYDIVESIPDFIINKKVNLIFSLDIDIFKFKSNSYIFKYHKNEFEKLIDKAEIMSILTNDLLGRIIIIEQNDVEFIEIFSETNQNEITRLDSINMNELYANENTEDRMIRNIKVNQNAFEKIIT